jgi:hypothetical protein
MKMIQVNYKYFSGVLEMKCFVYQDTIKNYAESSYDALGILLCLRINTQHQLIMQKRRIPSLDSFLNAITLQLWPRFQSILDLHIESVRKISSGSSSISLFSSPEIHPHFITRRYGEFAASILILNDGYNDQLLETRFVFVFSFAIVYRFLFMRATVYFACGMKWKN